MPGFCASIALAFILGVELFYYVVVRGNLWQLGWRGGKAKWGIGLKMAGRIKSSGYHVWVKFLGEKTQKCFPAGPLFLVFLMKSLSKCPSPKNLPPLNSPENIWLCTWTQKLFFLQNAPSWMFDSVLNTPVSITVQ